MMNEPKKTRGRPRKTPLIEGPPPVDEPKRGRGRPKKKVEEEEEEEADYQEKFFRSALLEEEKKQTRKEEKKKQPGIMFLGMEYQDFWNEQYQEAVLNATGYWDLTGGNKVATVLSRARTIRPDYVGSEIWDSLVIDLVNRSDEKYIDLPTEQSSQEGFDDHFINVLIHAIDYKTLPRKNQLDEALKRVKSFRREATWIGDQAWRDSIEMILENLKGYTHELDEEEDEFNQFIKQHQLSVLPVSPGDTLVPKQPLDPPHSQISKLRPQNLFPAFKITSGYEEEVPEQAVKSTIFKTYVSKPRGEPGIVLPPAPDLTIPVTRRKMAPKFPKSPADKAVPHGVFLVMDPIRKPSLPVLRNTERQLSPARSIAEIQKLRSVKIVTPQTRKKADSVVVFPTTEYESTAIPEPQHVSHEPEVFEMINLTRKTVPQAPISKSQGNKMTTLPVGHTRYATFLKTMEGYR